MLCCLSEVGSGYVKPVLHFRELSGERGLEGHLPSREARLRPVVERHQKGLAREAATTYRKGRKLWAVKTLVPFSPSYSPDPAEGLDLTEGKKEVLLGYPGVFVTEP